MNTCPSCRYWKRATWTDQDIGTCRGIERECRLIMAKKDCNELKEVPFLLATSSAFGCILWEDGDGEALQDV